MINSEYDSWVINNTLQERCLTPGSSGETLENCNAEQMVYIERYHQKFRDIMEYYTMVSRHSAWTIGCSNHGYLYQDEFYKN